MQQVGYTLGESVPVFQPGPRPRPGAPNVVMIVLDDVGFGQLGCYGSQVATPNIDALASQGLRYNGFNVTAICSSSRACLMTGRNHHAVGMGYLADYSVGLPGYSGRIPKSAASLARLLRDTGYNTFAVGKWHLAPRLDQGPAGPFDQWPLGMGFERYYGFLPGVTNHWTPDLVRDNGFIDPPDAPEDGYHLTEDMVTQANRMVQDQQQAEPGKPFFLYLATGAAHAPHQVPREWADRYRHRFDDGWEALRERTFHAQLELGVIPGGTKLTERPPWVPEWKDLPAEQRRLFSRMMEVYAGFLTHADAQLGRIVDLLGALGVLDNTVVMVLSDNGASADSGPHGALSHTVRDLATMQRRVDELGGFTASNHQPWGWAWAVNTPFRLWKRYSWLGGVRVPFVVRWPEGISAKSAGQVRTQFCHAIDVMPTILDITGVDPPSVLDGVTQQPIDGRSFRATFDDAHCPSPRKTQYFEMAGSRAIYDDGWKATTDHVGRHPSTGEPQGERDYLEGSFEFDTDRWLLFCLDADFSEADDISADHPKRLHRLVETWWYQAGRNQVLPLMDGNLAERLPAMESPRLPEQPRYVYLPGGGPISTPPLGGGFRIVVDLELPTDRSPAGVVLAQGDWHVGWACYVRDQRLTAAFSVAGVTSRLSADVALTTGEHQLAITYQPRADSGLIALILDGREIAAGPVRSAVFPPRYPGKLLIGRDRPFPVSDDYQPPFPFAGTIHQVVLELERSTQVVTDVVRRAVPEGEGGGQP